jgi:Glycosyl transferases group 1
MLASSLVSRISSERVSTNPSSARGLPGYPDGSAVPLPALIPDDTSVSDEIRKSRVVPGLGDPVHLGGMIDFATTNSISPGVFELIRTRWGTRSLLDVGCGRGWSALWFYLQGIHTQCVEGSPAALNQTVLPPSALVNHDFTRGPWWPQDTVDIAWSTSFVQQVPRSFMRNYVAALSKAAVVLMSFPRAPGWHSVEVHDVDWWVVQFERHGFHYSEELTLQVQEAAQRDANSKERGPDGQLFRTKDLASETLVFLNPRVSSLEEHDHLFPELGCYKGEDENGTLIQRECGTGGGIRSESALASRYLPPRVVNVKSNLWRVLVRKNIDGEQTIPEDVFVVRPTREAAKPVNISQHAVRQIPNHLELGRLPVKKIPVVVWPLWEFRGVPNVVNAESKHIEMNGVEESRFLELSDDIFNFDEDVIWVGDTGYAHGWNVWCSKFHEHVISAQERRRQLGLPTSWPIYIVDFTDYPNRQRCLTVETTVGLEFVTYTKRSMVKSRDWDPDKEWVNEGTRIPDETKDAAGILYRHTPLVVRTDTVHHIQEALDDRNMSIRDKIEEMDRPVDAMHLWPLDANVSKTVGTTRSNLRSVVSAVVDDVGNSTKLKIFVGVAGDAAHSGRRGVSTSYIDAILRTKILVVTQRDQWEDHYRLFEALAAGPLVMTDRMLALPTGLANGTSIIEFSSPQELRSLIQYYATHKAERLAIAAEGRRVAMSRHRSWHRMEEIIFGRPLSTCSIANPASGCPYIVHANETA